MPSRPRFWAVFALALLTASVCAGPAFSVAPTPEPGSALAASVPESTPTTPANSAEATQLSAAPEATSAESLGEIDPQGRDLPAVDAPAVDAEATQTGSADSTLAVAGETAVRNPDEFIVGLTAPLATTQHDVSVVGASWEPTRASVRVDIRVLHAGVWGGWEALSVDTEVEGAGRPGTEPYVVASGQDVQVRLTTDDRSVPKDARLDVFGGDVTAADITASQIRTGFGSGIRVAGAGAPAVGPATDAVGDRQESVSSSAVLPTATLAAATRTPMPSIRLRSAWGAVAPSGPMDIGEVHGVTVHHTAGTNDYAAAAVPAILRGVQNFHMKGRGWSDIGYNFLIDRYGGIWEGRSGGILNTTKGVHASSFNGITSGVSVMGNFEGATVTVAIKNALASLIAWKLALHGVGAAGTMKFNGVTYPTIVGHRDVPDAQTACPGRNLYAFLPTLRIMAAQRQVFPRVVMDNDLNGDAVPDIVTGPGAGTSYLGVREPLAAGVRIGTGWNAIDLIVGSPALSGGSTVDLVAREAATGRLTAFHGNGTGGFAGKTSLGLGWKAMSSVIAPGDWTGDGKNDLLAVQAATGDLYLYRGDGKGNIAAGQRIGHGWKGLRSVTAAGDMTGDGKPDLVAIVASTNEMRIYPGNGGGGFKGVLSLGLRFDAYDAVVGVGDVTGDSARDVFVRNTTTGQMMTLAGNKAGGTASKTMWGSGWGKKGALVSGPNWNGNGRPVLITFDRASGVLSAYEGATSVRFTPGKSLGFSADSSAGIVVGDVTGSGVPSIVTRGAAGSVYLHAAKADGTFAPPKQIGSGWSGMLQVAAAGDFDHDGTPDLLAFASNGVLYVYPFAPDGSGVLQKRFIIGQRFTGYRFVGVGGWSRSTSADILAINIATGQVRWYVGHGRGGLTGGTFIATGWRSRDVVSLGNVTGSGNNDLLARDTVTGRYWIYPANGLGGIGVGKAVVGVPIRKG